MWTRQYRKSPLRHAVLPCLALASLGYFSFHAVNGNLGLTSKQEYEQQLAGLQTQLDALVDTRQRLERRTAALSDGTMQRDMLDERARIALGLTRADEVVLFHEPDAGALDLEELVQRTN